MVRVDLPNVKVSVTGPSEVGVHLVPWDCIRDSNIFRICFEVFASLFAGLLGSIITLDEEKRYPIHWFTLTVFGLVALGFLGMTVWYWRKLRKADTDEEQPTQGAENALTT